MRAFSVAVEPWNAFQHNSCSLVLNNDSSPCMAFTVLKANWTDGVSTNSEVFLGKHRAATLTVILALAPGGIMNQPILRGLDVKMDVHLVESYSFSGKVAGGT